jgi:hypothetical protein
MDGTTTQVHAKPGKDTVADLKRQIMLQTGLFSSNLGIWCYDLSRLFCRLPRQGTTTVSGSL